MEWIKLWALGMGLMIIGTFITLINYALFGINSLFPVVPGALLALLSPIFGKEE